MNKILITGGCGFIGSHIVEKFLIENFIVTVIDVWKSPEIVEFEKKYKNLKFIKLNILEFDKLEEQIKVNDFMIHMAAILGTAETITTYDIEDVIKTNVLGTTKILKLAKKYKLKKVVIPTTPDVTWINPYKITKQAIEKTAQLFNLEYGLNVSCLKLGNIYGPRERWLEANQSNMDCPFNYQKVVPSFIMDTLYGKQITIYGDGYQKSEYIYVEDVVNAFYLTINSKENFGTEIIHVGSGKNLSVIDIIEGLEIAWNRKLEKNFVKMRPGEHKLEIALNPEPMKRLINYELKYDLVEGLKKTIPYYEKQFEIQKQKS